MVQLKDVIHLYLGCEVFDSYYKEQTKILDVQFFKWIQDCIEGGRMKLILRPLSDMTEEEAIELTKPIVVYGDIPNVRKYETYKNSFGNIVVHWGDSYNEKYLPAEETSFVPQQFIYALKHGFDLFKLIESGQAITKTNEV